MTDTVSKLRNTPIRKLYISYLIPSVLGMLLMAINIVVDGIFVGHAFGPVGLASVNIATPVFSIFFSIALMIGIGGATIYSISLGKGDVATARQVFSQAFFFSILLVACIASICLWQIETLAYLFGANKKIMPYVLDYLSVILIFGIIFVLESVLSTFIRNDGNPNLAMIGLAVNAILNIIFNYLFLFVFHLGISGAAYATVLAAVIGFFVLLLHFRRPQNNLKLQFTRLRFRLLTKIVSIGLPSFVAEVSLALITLAFNLAFMKNIGEMGVAAYAVVNYIHTVNMLVFIGVGAALQPISSFHFGSQLGERLAQSLRVAIKTAWGFGLVALTIGYFQADLLVAAFGLESKELISFTTNGIQLYFFAYLFLGYNMLYAEYYQSINQSGRAMLITICQGMLFIFPLLWLLPLWLDVTGIWLAYPAAQLLTTLIVIWMNRHKHPIFGYLYLQNQQDQS